MGTVIPGSTTAESGGRLSGGSCAPVGRAVARPVARTNSAARARERRVGKRLPGRVNATREGGGASFSRSTLWPVGSQRESRAQCDLLLATPYDQGVVCRRLS